MKNLRKVAFTLIMVGMLALPSISSAQSVSDLQAQIAALLAQLQQLQKQVAQMQGGSQQWCHTFSKNLKIEDSNSEIQNLSNALVKEGLLDEKSAAKDNFDESIAAAVTGFQEKYRSEILTPNGLSRGTGYAGPSTRKKLNQLYGCGGISKPTQPTQPTTPRTTPPLQQSFTASPTYGVAPLTVTFSAMGVVADMDFGDGTEGEISNACIEAVTSCESRTYHNYTSAGTYIVKMKRRSSGEILGTATITATDSNSDLRAPAVNGIDGPASLNAGQVGKWTVRASVPNQPGAQLSYSVVWGDDTGIVSMSPSQANTSLQTSATFTHTYTYNNTYKPKFTVSNSYGSASAEMTVIVGDSVQNSVVSAWLTDPTGNGREVFSTGDQIVINWSVAPFHGDPNYQTSIDLFPYGANPTVTPVIRVYQAAGAAQGRATWTVSKNGLFGGDTVSSGRYYVYVNAYDSQKGGYVVGIAGPITINTGQNSASITVAAPNGGENWNIGGTYTIRYSLRGISVDASNPILIYLQKGYDYPSTKSGVNSSLLIGTTKDTESYSYTVPTDIANWPGLGNNFTIKVCANNCSASDTSDSTFSIGKSELPSITVTAPNGGELIPISQNYTIRWSQTGINHMSIALYQDDKWVSWINKNVGSDGVAAGEYSWGPSTPMDPIAQATLGKVFKIYITGQKADGSGYVDDKSDAPFGFVSSAQTVAPTLTLTASPSTVTAGQSSTLTWSSTNATSCAAYENGSPAQYNPEKVLFNDSSTQAFYETKTYTFTCKGPGGSVTKSVTVNVQTAASIPSVDMKVDDSDGPVALSDNKPITIKLTTNKVTSCALTGVRGYSGGPIYQDSQIPMSGSVNSYSLYASAKEAITVRCIGSSDGSSVYDTVYVNPASTPANQSTQQIPESTKQMANTLQSMTAILQNMLQSFR